MDPGLVIECPKRTCGKTLLLPAFVTHMTLSHRWQYHEAVAWLEGRDVTVPPVDNPESPQCPS